MMLSLAILALLSVAAPWVCRYAGPARGVVLAAFPLGIGAWFASKIPSVADGGAIVETFAWLPELGLEMTFRLDGLGLLFALLVTLIGAGVLLYAGSYMQGHHQIGRFFAYLIGFMTSMLGLVLADNLILLFIFWELTSITSYLLIGFNHDKKESRSGALQALMVTGLGGLAMLAGLVVLAFAAGDLAGVAGGVWNMSELPEGLSGHAHYPWIVALVLAGCLTKSAQFPFHFWLPSAMAAPSPVSAYLHSSTMVKAGVYLIARLHPNLATGTAEGLWEGLLIGFGAATMFVGAYLATRQTLYKRLLAYSTVSSLGVMVMLIGMGHPDAAAAYILAHAMFKGCLFLVAGIVDHEAGEKDVAEIGRLFRAMPATGMAALLAGISMAGVPLAPLAGFVAKEKMIKAGLDAGPLTALLTALIIAAGSFTVFIAIMTGFKPFFGKAQREPKKHAHEAPWPMLAAPVILAVLGIVYALVPALFATPVVTAAGEAIKGGPFEAALRLDAFYYYEISLALGLSLLATLIGVGIYFGRGLWVKATSPFAKLDGVVGPARMYDYAMLGLTKGSWAQTRVLQNGSLQVYIKMTLVAILGMFAWAIWRTGALPSVGTNFERTGLLEWVLIISIAVSAIVATRLGSRLATVAVLGVIGYAVAVVFALYGGPDAAMTQFAVETLIVVIFVLVVYHLPRFAVYSGLAVRMMDLLLAATFGGVMACLVLAAGSQELFAPISAYFNEAAMPETPDGQSAYGRNLVNIILVDFRSVDTLGELVVLGIAAIGVYTLMKLRDDHEGTPVAEREGDEDEREGGNA